MAVAVAAAEYTTVSLGEMPNSGELFHLFCFNPVKVKFIFSKTQRVVLYEQVVSD